MTNILEHTENFGEVAARTINDMFGVDIVRRTEPLESSSVATSKTFLVSIYYTGTVYGEYLLAMDESTAAKICGIEEPISQDNRDEVRETICDAMAETLNTIVGEAIVHLQRSFAKLTLTAPRIFLGEVRYPKFRTGLTTLCTTAGDIECHFCLDLMRLDLATSYQEAMGTLIDVNAKLKEANRHLAEQQAQLVLTEKMASVGILASGVAHEINNPLFFVDANLTTLGEYIAVIESILNLYDRLCESLHGADGRWTEELKLIHEENQEQDIEFVMEDTKQLMRESRDGIARIKNIVQGLRDFSQVDRGGFSEADLNVIAENACALVASTLPQHCRLEKQFAELPKLVCNAAEIGQVVASILINAGQAINGSGSISLRSESTDSNVILIAEDNGRGIDPKHIDHIFEPFFTTREEGAGTGLGLSIAYGIVQKHNGSISVHSTLGEGTKVTVRLPLVHEPAAAH
jgi:two-component system, NtrC family, sensor kinase